MVGNYFASQSEILQVFNFQAMLKLLVISVLIVSAIAAPQGFDGYSRGSQGFDSGFGTGFGKY